MHGSSHGIWSAIANSKHNQTDQSLSRSNLPIEYDLSSSRKSVCRSNSELISGYIELVDNRIQKGWSCHLLTMVFCQLPGKQDSILSSMKDEIERIYRTLVTRIDRNPKRASADELPLLIGSADLPVQKFAKMTAPLVNCNGGLHVHLVLLIPPTSRLKEPVQQHFEDHAGLYHGVRKLVQRIDVKQITETPHKVVDYVLKTIKNRKLSYDDAMIVFPKAKTKQSW